MAKQNSFVRKAARWVARMFGYKAESKFGKAVWYVFITCTTIIALALVIDIYDALHLRVERWCYYAKTQRSDYLHDYSNQYVSPYVIFHDDYPGYLFNTTSGQRTLEDILWICKSSDNDSLAVYSTVEERKRGYFNRFTGEVAIPAQYDKAWIFSEGLACALSNGIINIIDHKGKSVTDKSFPYSPVNDDYCFHNGLCCMLGGDSSFGLIDRQGNWVVAPEYQQMTYNAAGFWVVIDNEWNRGLLKADGQPLLPCEYNEITIHRSDSTIFVIRDDHLCQVLDYDGNVINPCHFNGILKMEYKSDEYDEYGELKPATANCMKYHTTEYRYGLMDKNGNVVTSPNYNSIEAISANRFHCFGPKGSVILDDKGNEVGEKL